MDHSAQLNLELPTPSNEIRPYLMRISRLTVDKLGVKLYDRASAVVAELLANSYDADAEIVTVRLPLSTVLATKNADGEPLDNGFFIEVEDDGYGMTPDEAIDFYLQVGRDRRKHEEQGGKSREKGRPVMGRKGIGKLAPFGICKRIELISAGGAKTSRGYLVTHFYMDFDKILSDTDEPVKFDRGTEDRTYRPNRGTRIRLMSFLPKRVPDATTFHRQLAARFIFAKPDFSIIVEDTRNPSENPPTKVEPISVPVNEQTRIDLSKRPVTTEDGASLPVAGWLAMAINPYKYEELAGVRIYARNKIVATTRDFEQPAGFTGEFTIRSYLVGEIYAEWLDLDDGDDLIRSDRQGILWDSDYGRALRTWGADLIKEIGKLSSKPRREKAQKAFMEKSNFVQRAKDKYNDTSVVDTAVDLAKQIGSFAAEDELENEEYVDGLADVILSVAPHRALIEALREFSAKVAGGEVSLDNLIGLFGKARIAEMASYSQIAAERVRVIRELENILLSDSDEAKLQRLISEAPWLIEPTWTVITKNQSLKTFKITFENYWLKRTGETVVLTIDYDNKRPDFTLISIGKMLHIVEIKAPGHSFNDTDMDRLIRYVDAFTDFFEANRMLLAEFPNGWMIDLVADGTNISQSANNHAFKSFERDRKVVRISWIDFLTRAKNAHEAFLQVNE